LVKAKRSKKVRYWINYRFPNQKPRREAVGYLIKKARFLELHYRALALSRENGWAGSLDPFAPAPEVHSGHETCQRFSTLAQKHHEPSAARLGSRNGDGQEDPPEKQWFIYSRGMVGTAISQGN
jgi:hypothetical protein